MKRYKTFVFYEIVKIINVGKKSNMSDWTKEWVETSNGSFHISSFYSKPKIGELYKLGSDCKGWALKYNAKLNKRIIK